MKLIRLRMGAITAGLCVMLLAATLPEKKPRDAAQWETDIRAFEEKDKASPPAKQGILFIGSSSIRRWDLERWFPKLGALNRGFGGSHISDSIAFTSRIVLPYQPRIIAFYAGDNDLQYGKSPETVCEDFKTFVRAVHARLPQTRIVFISIKPSPARVKLMEQQIKANALIREFIEKDKRLVYVDVWTPMLGPDGQPRADLFVKDMLHLNDEGYKLWTSLVLSHLVENKAKQSR